MFLFDFPAFRSTAESRLWTRGPREVRVVRFVQHGREWFLVDASIADSVFEDNWDAREGMGPLCVASDVDHVARWFFAQHAPEPGFTPRTFRYLHGRALPLDSPLTRRCLRDWQRTLVRATNRRQFRGWGSRANVWGGFY
jgi:hypothetical protein